MNLFIDDPHGELHIGTDLDLFLWKDPPASCCDVDSKHFAKQMRSSSVLGLHASSDVTICPAGCTAKKDLVPRG